MMNLKAIETEYHGYLFRSRLEARWAVFLDALRIPWDYEQEGFDLPGVGYYLPDFRLLDQDLWLEIKPTDPTHDEKRKAQALAEQSGNNVAILHGRITVPTMHWFGDLVLGLADSTYYGMTFYGSFHGLRESDLYLMGYVSLPEWIRGHAGWEAPEFDGSIECARELRRIDYAIQCERTDDKAGKYLDRVAYGVVDTKQVWATRDSAYGLFSDGHCSDTWLDGELLYAYEKAQQARFEHGVKP